MIYVFQCDTCHMRCNAYRTVADRNQPFGHYHALPGGGTEYHPMHRVLTVPQVITQPFHLREENRFRGDGTDYKEYRRKYDRMWDTREDRQKSIAREQADMAGAEIVAVKPTKSIAQMAKEKGIPLRS